MKAAREKGLLEAHERIN
jgi:hypothetical protein